MLGRVVIAVVATCALALTFCFSPSSIAHAQTVASGPTGSCPYWIDNDTGTRPAVGPPGYQGPSTSGTRFSSGGHNYHQQPDGTWIDNDTGTQPAVGPPGYQGPSTSGTRFNSGGHNYHLVPCPPKTAAVQVGSVPIGTSPWALAFSTGADFMHYSSSYRSTGTQAPLDASSNHTSALICGGVNAYWSMPGLMPSGYVGTVGGGINICGVAGGKSDLYRYVVHPGNGAVTATVDPGPRIEAYIGYHWDAFGPEANNPYIFMRYGPVFAENKISVTSNQTGAGGNLESASHSGWNVGAGVELGISSPLCGDCAFGHSLRWSISGKGYWFGAGPSVTVHSSAFGFDETAKINRSAEYSLNFGLSTPLQ